MASERYTRQHRLAHHRSHSSRRSRYSFDQGAEARLVAEAPVLPPAGDAHVTSGGLVRLVQLTSGASPISQPAGLKLSTRIVRGGDVGEHDGLRRRAERRFERTLFFVAVINLSGSLDALTRQ